MAERSFGIAPVRPELRLDELRDHLLAAATEAPELWHQKAYLSSVVTVSADDGILDHGTVPLTHFLDAGGPDGAAMTIEADGQGSIYPVVYIRRDGRVDEHALDPHPMNEFEGAAYRRELGALLDLIAPGASAA